jgi:two-component system chemotaxis response regulator CheB
MADSLIRVLLAEDSPTVRHHLTQVINEIPGLTVIGEARDGTEAIELVESLRPDVISMDIRMPRLDGLEATRRIMALRPTPIVMVSSLLDEEIELSFQAMQAGALAVVPKPPSRDKPTFADQQRQLGTTLVAMAGVSVIRRWHQPPQVNGAEHSVVLHRHSLIYPEILAIGASAGGPSALSSLFAALPEDFPLPILAVQHMPGEFVVGLARWLAETTRLRVRVAQDDQLLQAGVIDLSPGNIHLKVSRQGDKLVSRLLPGGDDDRYQPSVDVLFHSVAEICGERAIGVILTGMGDDGAEGLLAMRRAGARTFAQDRGSSTVYGMPGAALERGGVEQVLPLSQLPSALLKLL